MLFLKDVRNRVSLDSGELVESVVMDLVLKEVNFEE